MSTKTGRTLCQNASLVKWVAWNSYTRKITYSHISPGFIDHGLGMYLIAPL
ncbi:uncharacterized protein LY79DRAFT_173608 [Colletotrichum navitas]|uniref:Uncharacterized protein n=1 Tax=Colletotrichum navitas TaxID=681940 RepID=A0AAD8UXY1_9PEZI|nr:uncharacterized protein LY79DRAFT_173608 [Colletotrichum navitas]KAK1563966.1 hypothetical protein LY79DRAFT_173608 [Colletotrichum navitas]